MKFGVPMGQDNPTTEYTLSVLVEPRDRPLFYKTWRGKSVRGIHKAAKKQYLAEYPGARIMFGVAIPRYSWGAH